MITTRVRCPNAAAIPADVQIEVWGLEPDANRSGAASYDHRLAEEPRWAQKDHLITGADHRVERQCDRSTGAAGEEHILRGEVDA
jgi:hypothetical protein